MNIKKLTPYLGRNLAKKILPPILASKVMKDMKPNEPWVLPKLQAALKVDNKAARRIYRKGIESEIKFQIDFAWLARAEKHAIYTALDSIQLQNFDNAQTLLDSGRPIILLSIHMGSFYLGFLKLAMAVKAEREISIIKVANSSEQEESLHRVIEEKFKRIQVLRFDEDVGKRAYLTLRRGGIVAMMTDVEVRVPSREPVNMFDQQCFIQNGVAKLALTTRAAILPIINFTDKDGHQIIRIENPLLPDKIDGNETNQTIVTRLMQEIARLIESWIRIDPVQFQRWTDVAWTLYRQANDPEPIQVIR